jgi:hypothetical protein
VTYLAIRANVLRLAGQYARSDVARLGAGFAWAAEQYLLNHLDDPGPFDLATRLAACIALAAERDAAGVPAAIGHPGAPSTLAGQVLDRLSPEDVRQRFDGGDRERMLRDAQATFDVRTFARLEPFLR